MTQQLLAPALPGISRSDVDAISRGEPAWLRDARMDAWRQYEAMDFPDPSDEEWRRTDVRAISFHALRIEQAAQRFDAGALPAGVVLTELRTAAREYEHIVRRYLYQNVAPGEWKYLALNAALWSGGAFLYVPRGVELAAPVTSLLVPSADGAALFPRTIVVAEAGSKLILVDETESGAGAPSLVSGAVELFIGDGAQVEYYNLNRWGENVYNFNTVRATLGRDATFTALAAGIGSKLTKMRIDTLMPEPGARADLLGVTFGDGDQHFDYNTRQEHTGAHTISDLQFKSALTDSASLVWYGVTRINHGASASEANQTSRNLLLSEHAKAAPIPILEIEAYDVAKCSHGATAGPVEETELFYLESRGIPRETAEHMLVEGFFADVIDRIPNAALRDRVLDAVLEKAGTREGGLTFDEVLAAG